jgi:hypothetical protein
MRLNYRPGEERAARTAGLRPVPLPGRPRLLPVSVSAGYSRGVEWLAAATNVVLYDPFAEERREVDGDTEIF